MSQKDHFSGIPSGGIFDFSGLTPEQRKEILDENERIRQINVKLFSQSPAYQAEAAKDPHYWERFPIIIWNVENIGDLP